MNTLTLLLVLVALLNLLGAIIVLTRNYRKIENIAFFGIGLGISCWSIGIAGFISSTNLAGALSWAQFYYGAPIILVFSAVIFAQYFNYHKGFYGFFNIFVALYGLILLGLILGDRHFLATGVIRTTYGKQVMFRPKEYAIYSVYILTCFVVTIDVLYSKLKKTKQYLAKQQLQLFLLGFCSASILGVFFNLILPWYGNYQFISLGPLATTIFFLFVIYAIVKHRLFDIKFAVTRSIAYLLIIATMISLFSVGLFGIIDVVFRGHQNEFLRQVLSIILVTPLALSFQSIKRFFDRITNKLFYRDSYDLQEVLDNIGNVVVSEINLHNILNNTRKILSDALKSSFIEFILLKDNEPYFEATDNNVLIRNLTHVIHQMKDQHSELLVADEMSYDNVFHKKLTESGIAISLRLKTQRQTVGYILVGDKLSGEVYNNIDKNLLLIAANELAVTIQNALRFQEIENFNATLQLKIVEATNQLRRSNEKLKSLDEAKDDFISLASHQLRTPLTTIKGYISMLLEGDAGDPLNPTEKKFLQQSFVSSQRMVALIADLLNLSRMKTGKFLIEAQPCNLADITEEEVNQLIETASSRQIELSFKKPEHFPSLMIDEIKIRQVIMNFIDNSIYYTPRQGKIVVELINKPQRVDLTVTDNGIGVPRNVQYNLFHKFFRADNAKKARPDGTGLGLFMAKKVIIAHGGVIIFKSEENVGSVFGFSLYKAKLPTPVNPTDNSHVLSKVQELSAANK